MDQYFLATSSDFTGGPAGGCVAEFEDVITACCGAWPISTEMGPARRGPFKLLGRTIRSREADGPPRRSFSTRRILIIAALTPGDIYRHLTGLRASRMTFDVTCAYLFDAFLLRNTSRAGGWFHYSTRLKKCIAALDHLFIPMSGSVKAFKSACEIPVSMLPMGVDVARFGSPRLDRPIAVNGYGRQEPDVLRAIESRLNAPDGEQILYHTSHSKIATVIDVAAQRRLFWKFLTRSRIALAYDPAAVGRAGRFSFSFVGQRWFESLAAGCLIVGRRPRCPEADELLDWEDATVEAPEDPEQAAAFLMDLLADDGRLAAAHRRNYEESLRRHDWRLRVATLVDRLGLPRPESLGRELEALGDSRSLLPLTSSR